MPLTNFPASLDIATNPTAGTVEGSSSRVSDSVGGRTHAVMHGFENDAILALEAKVGADSSGVITSLDYKVSHVPEASLVLTDVTTNNVTSSKHGFAPKSPADATQFLNGAATPIYAQVKDSDLSTSDVTTNNVSTTKHGFVPKAPNDASKFLDGTGAYSTPGGSSAITTAVPLPVQGKTGAANKATATNTTLLVGLVNITNTITVNKISVDINTVNTSGSIKLALYSEDGQTLVIPSSTFSITVNGLNTFTLASPATISPGNYYFAWVTVGTTDLLCRFWATNAAWDGNPLATISGKKTIEGTLTVTAGTIPSTITPSAISFVSESTQMCRFDN